MGAPGRVGARDTAARLRDMGDNAGNLIFQHAVTRLLDADRVHLWGPDAPWGDAAILQGARALVFPAANHLRTGADWTGLCDFLDRPGPPLVVLGLGVQAPRGAGVAETAAALAADPQARRLAAVLGARAAFISVRGAFSQAVCAALGIGGTVPLGCPSALLHPDPGLGMGIAGRLAGLAAALAGKGARVRLAMNAAAPFEIRGQAARLALEQRLFDWVVARHGGLYVQQSGGVAACDAAGGNWHRLAASTRAGIAGVLAPEMAEVDLWAHLARGGRAPHDAGAWIAEMAGIDLAIGTRVHGALAALAAGRPGVLIPHDARTAELARTHHLPWLDPDDVLGARDPGAALGRVRFDPGAFDRARRASAAGLAAALEGLGLAPASALLRLAGRDRARWAA